MKKKVTTTSKPKATPKKKVAEVLVKVKPSQKVEEAITLDETITPEQPLKSSGLGDLVSKVTKALGIEECDGCKKRKEKWNTTFPWLKGQRDLTEDEYKLIISIQKNKRVEAKDTDWLFRTYNEVFKSKVEKCQCPGLITVMIKRLITWGEIKYKNE